MIVRLGGLSLLFSILAILWTGGQAAGMVNGFQVAIGLLLLSVTSATSLAEERVRGSLDLLLSTPLSTRQIVVGQMARCLSGGSTAGDSAGAGDLGRDICGGEGRWWAVPA